MPVATTTMPLWVNVYVHRVCSTRAVTALLCDAARYALTSPHVVGLQVLLPCPHADRSKKGNLRWKLDEWTVLCVDMAKILKATTHRQTKPAPASEARTMLHRPVTVRDVPGVTAQCDLQYCSAHSSGPRCCTVQLCWSTCVSHWHDLLGVSVFSG